MTLIAILIGTLTAGIGSVWLAAVLSFGVLARYTQHMLSLAAGALLATAFMHLLPEAFESQAAASDLFKALLVGLVFFFVLDKAELWHHGHEHGAGPSDGHAHARHNSAQAHGGLELRADCDYHGAAHGPAGLPVHAAKSGTWAVLAGDSVHAFGDGILIASAFIADVRLGVVAALAVLVHEVPHHMGDLIVLRASSDNRRAAVAKVSLAGAVTSLGGVVGYALVDQLYAWLPFFLVVAASSFIYVALADLIPQLQKRVSPRETTAQIAWLLIGVAVVSVISSLAHGG